MNTYAFIDGFNLYHILDEHYKHTGENLKWLSYPALISLLAGQDISGDHVSFFTAPPKHLNYDKQIRHRNYCQSQQSLGVQVVEGRFKRSNARCKSKECGAFLTYPVNQEKQTDVNIALHVLEKAYQIQQGSIYLLTADTDQVPTAQMVQRLFPDIRFYWVYPRRDSIPDEVRQTVAKERIIALRWAYFRRSQMPTTIQAGETILTSPYAETGRDKLT